MHYVKDVDTVGSDPLTRMLQRVGYSVVRQRGSHIRLLHSGSPAHSITVPMHDPLKTGTLHAILAEAALNEILHDESLVALL